MMDRRTSRRDRAARASGYGSWKAFVLTVRNTARCEDVAVRWGGLELKRAGDGWLACCPFHPDSTPSLSLGGRVFYCHGASCDASGDVIDLARKLSGLDFTGTVLALADDAGLQVPDIPQARGRRRPAVRRHAAAPPAKPALNGNGPASWPLGPPPDRAPLPVAGRLRVHSPRRGCSISFRADSWHEYRSIEGALTGLTARVEYGDGRKSVLPVTWRVDPASGRGGWVLKGWSGPRPVYGMQRLRYISRTSPAVIIVEGEKTADAAHRMLGEAGWAAISASGGSKSSERADWRPLRDFARNCSARLSIAVWPDADERPRTQGGESRLPAALSIERIMSGLTAAFGGTRSFRSLVDCRVVLPPDGLPHGWDLADAELAGWDAGRVMRELAGARAWTGKPGWDADQWTAPISGFRASAEAGPDAPQC